MNNGEVASVFQDIADLLELKGESVFKVRAYQKAVRSIEQLSVELSQLRAEGKLREVPGIGEAIEKKIGELLDTGHLKYYEEIRAEFPEGVISLLQVPGVGPKTAMKLWTELGIKSTEDLEKAILDGRVAGLFRMGDKTAENILRGLQSMRTKEQRIPIGTALPLAEEIIASLQERAAVRNVTPAGSLRRFRETIGDIDLMGTADDAEAVIEAFTTLPQVREVLAKGGTKASIVTKTNLQVDFRVVPHDEFGSLLQYFTGSKQHNIDLRERALKHGLSLSEYGITVVETGRLERFATEEAFYARLGLQYIPPEFREGTNEIALAEEKKVPRPIESPDVQGDLHVHSNWSDGHDSIEDMALAARARGYRYIAVTDHSKGLGIAHGLNEERVREQRTEINRLNEILKDFRVLAGIEVDIRADGSLDLPDEVLAGMDIVVASVHSAMGQEQEKMTRRIIRAMENPHVDVIGHPTGRLLGVREAIAVDMEAIFQAAARTGTALEINAMPDRLDLKDIHIFRARELGVKLSLGTDAHGTEHLPLMRFGVGIARRGWAGAGHVLNTVPVEGVLTALKH
jgi:DNA polymerase (family 10)